MHTRYFKAESGPFVDRMNQFVDDRKAAIKKAQALAKELGADYPAMTSNGIVGFVFKENEPPAHVMHKKTGHTHDDKGNKLYRPDKRRKAGKELARRMAGIQMPDNERAVVDVFDCGNQWVIHTLAGRMALAVPTCGFIKGVALARVPVADATDGDNESDRANWEPPQIEGVVEISQREFNALATAEDTA